jgi:hypothetical protein
VNDLAQLLERIKAKTGIQDPERLLLVTRVGFDYAALQARAMAGENVTEELAIVAATAANLDEHARGVIGTEFLAWTQGLLAKALGIAILAA